MALLLRSIAGSRLYGLQRPDSDYDFYDVHTSPLAGNLGRERKAVQTIEDGTDVMAVGLSQFIDLADSSSHQALDAMFAEDTEVDLIGALRRGYRVSSSIVPVYNGVISKFASQNGGTPRKRKHAVRLTYNMVDAYETGRYNPRLTPERAERVMTISQLPDADFYSELMAITPLLDVFYFRGAAV